MVRKIIELTEPLIITLQETKMVHFSYYDIKQICVHSDYGWTYLQSFGNFGGIIILWDKNIIDFDDSLVGDYTISIACSNKEDGFNWILKNVNRTLDVTVFWEESDNVCKFWDLPWCLGGDFKIIGKYDEKKGCNRITKNMENFSKFITQHDLINLPLKGVRYT